MNVKDEELAALYPGGRYLRPDQLHKIEAAIIERNALKATLTAVRAELDKITAESEVNGITYAADRIRKVLEAKP